MVFEWQRMEWRMDKNRLTKEAFILTTKQNKMYNTLPTRKELVEILEDLLGDEFDSSELVYLTEAELIHSIINTAIYFRDQWHENA